MAVRRTEWAEWLHRMQWETGEAIAALGEKGRRVAQRRDGTYRSWDPEVLAADQVAERILVREVAQRGLRATILSEEMGRRDAPGGAAGPGGAPDYYIVADPLDGSLAYRRSMPFPWLVAIGILDGQARPVATSVFEIQRRLVWWSDGSGAWAGRMGAGGAVEDARRLACSSQRELDGSVVVTGISKPRYLFPSVERFAPVFRRAAYILSYAGPMGAAMMASGMADAYIAWDLPLTEVFSAIGLAVQNGAILSDLEGAPLEFRPDVESRYHLVCSGTEEIHREILEALRG